MALGGFEALRAEIADCPPVKTLGRVTAIGSGLVTAAACGLDWRLGDRVRLCRGSVQSATGEIIGLDGDNAQILTDLSAEGLRPGDTVERLGAGGIAPDESWIGRIIDPLGQPIDGRPLRQGTVSRPLRNAPPAPADRRGFGPRLETGTAVFNTLLPLVRGQRIGLFAGAGVGKSSLLASFARGASADVIVIALVGERGREVREFAETVLGAEGMARSVIVTATSDQSPLMRRRCAWTAMAVAEYFRDLGRQVLLLADSITRFAEAHREVALASGEPPALRGFPPSTSQMIMALAERAGPGAGAQGDITAVFSVLVAGSDMDEPVADILRGVLDGHVVMDRDIAERGRFPAINVLKSVSRSLPAAASAQENEMIARARRYLGAYDRAEMMIQAGLYAAGSDAMVDAALRVWPALDAFVAEDEPADSEASFARLRHILDGASA
ncbi:MAG: FliI/YscN family ATPase [Rhodobacteraceae bacterium]|nr:FliI/YscN family ATPase [Paracoccaceae bacterium]